MTSQIGFKPVTCPQQHPTGPRRRKKENDPIENCDYCGINRLIKLINNSGNIDEQNKYGESLLLLAVKTNNQMLTRQVLKAKADTKLTNELDLAPIHLAVQHPHKDRIHFIGGGSRQYKC